jgi:hypothetical protein
MLQDLLKALVEMLVATAGRAILEFFELDQVAALITAICGLVFIATGFALWWLGN